MVDRLPTPWRSGRGQGARAHLLRFLLASRPETIGPVLVIVYRVIAGSLTDEAGIPQASTHAGAVTLIQHFGSALNLNVHFHMLFLDGVYDAREEHRLNLHRPRAPTPAQLARLTATIKLALGKLAPALRANRSYARDSGGGSAATGPPASRNASQVRPVPSGASAGAHRSARPAH